MRGPSCSAFSDYLSFTFLTIIQNLLDKKTVGRKSYLIYFFQNMKKIDGNPMTVDFEDLQGRIHKLLYNALQIENDTINTQTLLGGLMLTIQEAGQGQDQAPRK